LVHPGGATLEQKKRAIERCYGRALLAAAATLLPPRMRSLGVQATDLRVRRFRSRWGSCDTRSGALSLALELATREPECLEYVVVHELAHLRVPNHSAAFKAILDGELPDWRRRRRALNDRARSRLF
jgi:hypothetical protein